MSPFLKWVILPTYYGYISTDIIYYHCCYIYIATIIILMILYFYHCFHEHNRRSIAICVTIRVVLEMTQVARQHNTQVARQHSTYIHVVHGQS